MDLDCQKCTEQRKISRGCKEEAPAPVFEMDGEKYYRCPLKLIRKETLEYVRFHRFFQMGYLPNAGGLLEQPAKFLNAIEVIENAKQ